MKKSALILFLTLLPFMAKAQNTQNSEDGKKIDKEKLESKDYLPEIHGTIRGKYEYQTTMGAGRFEVRNARVSVTGNVLPIVAYKAEIDLSDEGSIKIDWPWRKDHHKKRNRIYGGGMKLLIAFFKDKTREISLYAGTVGIFIVVAFLYNIRMDALKYALLLVILWLLLYVITEYHRFRKKHLLLERFKKSTQECTKELPECRNLLELDYQELLGIFDEKILELKSEARIKGQDLSDYYGMWVHQIKTPIAAMHILLQSVEDENPALPELKEMKMELFKMEQYVEMVLTYLRMEDMSGDLQFEKVSLDKILKQSVRKYSQMFILQKIRLDYRPVERIVLTDEKWLEFVTEQILSNALKYTKNGGEIRICLEEKRGRECLVIEDNGIGIQAEDLPRVFEKGFTGYNGRADKKSTGIGLYLCKKIMDKMGHKIWIDSEVGKGTRVYLELTRKEWNPE